MKRSAKASALKIIEQLPDDSTLDDIMYELYFTQKVRRGFRDLAAGRTVSHEAVVKSLRQWLASAGH